METEILKVVYKPKADKQIYQFMVYIENKGYPETAEKFTARLYEFGYSLAVFPEKYSICRHKQFAKRNLRCAVFDKNYIFIYKVIKDHLVIYNVIHGKTLK